MTEEVATPSLKKEIKTTERDNLLYIREFLNIPTYYGFAGIVAKVTIDKDYNEEGKLMGILKTNQN